MQEWVEVTSSSSSSLLLAADFSWISLVFETLLQANFIKLSSTNRPAASVTAKKKKNKKKNRKKKKKNKNKNKNKKKMKKKWHEARKTYHWNVGDL
ncbi:hypothetical protein ElyMa_004003300 [Elysia marginata]|uniref:Uncharacterized protein n=1 Tax=Elysia marginata TaxID=1093978 RepID=A0AAV4G0Q7_9GAST|nr:hypothetical protein ElyMa_004003300 [Elysia marginata]